MAETGSKSICYDILQFQPRVFISFFPVSNKVNPKSESSCYVMCNLSHNRLPEFKCLIETYLIINSWIILEILRKMRTLDDKIIYTFNKSIPTDSFKAQINESATCKHLYDELQTNYRTREQNIKQCIDVLASEICSLKQEKEAHPDNIQLLKHLRKEQTSLRLLQTELGVEEVIKERTIKVFNEHCRNYYKPSEASP